MLNPHHKPQERQWDGPIHLPKSICVLMNEESKEGLKQYNLEPLQKFMNRTVQKALCCLDEPTHTPGAEPEDQPFRSTQIMILRHMILYLISSTARLLTMSNWSKHSRPIRS